MLTTRHKFRYPRLSAALALTGLFTAFNATASNETDCISRTASFGDFEVYTSMFPNYFSGEYEFTVNLSRDMPNARSNYMMEPNQGEQIYELHKATLHFEIVSIPNSRTQYVDSKVNEIYLTFPNRRANNSNSIISHTKIHLNDSEHRPVDDNERWQRGVTREDYSTDLSDEMFLTWARGNAFVVEFFLGESGVIESPIGSVVVGKDEFQQYNEVVFGQMEWLVGEYEQLNCGDAAALLDEDCFLTTATVRCIGLADDCWELQSLRDFRDHHLMKSVSGRELVAEYYEIAPAIVKAINSRVDGEKRWLKTYWAGILPTALMVKLGFHDMAARSYYRMVKKLQALL